MDTLLKFSEQPEFKVTLAEIIESPAKQKTPRTARIKLGPVTAERWLTNCNLHNRPLVESRWYAIAVDIVEGNWRYTGQPIIFGSNGILLDGQNRLRACQESLMQIETAVTFGMPPEVQEKIDTGTMRTAGDIAHLAGVENANAATSVAKLLLHHERFGINRSPSQFAKLEKIHGKMKITWSKPTKQQIIEAAKNLPGLGGRISEGQKWVRTRLVAPRYILFCYYLFAKQDEAKAKEFFDQVILAENLRSSTATHLLHRQLVDMAASKYRMLPVPKLALIFKTWIAYRDGRNNSVRNLKWNPNGGEDFPEL